MEHKQVKNAGGVLCLKAGVGHGLRVGIANGTLTQQDGADYGNRLVCQLYVSTEMLAHPDASADLPAAVITNGAGWYTCYATTGDFEDMGQFPMEMIKVIASVGLRLAILH